MPPHRKDRRRTLRSFYVWHRWIGIVCALLVMWLALTGILLNHATGLGFDRHYIHSPWLLRAYGMHVQPPETGFPVPGHWIVQAGDQLFLDAEPVAELHGELVGAVALSGLYLAASADTIILMTAEGEMIESLGRESLPGAVQAIAGGGQQVLIQTADAVYVSDMNLLSFERHTNNGPAAAKAKPLPTELAQAITAAGGGVRLSRERVLTDLHSGRLFGRYGPLIMDLASLGFIFLALSGLWLWWRYRQSQHDRTHQRQR